MKNIFEKCIEKLILYGSQDLLKNEGAQTEEKNKEKNKESKEKMGIKKNNEWRKLLKKKYKDCEKKLKKTKQIWIFKDFWDIYIYWR